MKHLLIIAIIFTLAAVGCQQQSDFAMQPELQSQDTAIAASMHKATPDKPMNFRANLKGRHEVPPVDTRAQGEAIFKLSKDGSTLHYKLIVANIYNVFMAHIHWADASSNGPVVAWLYPGSPPASLIPGRTQGVLAQGTITASDLVGPLAGMTMADLVAEIEKGMTYVNVHTTQNAPGEIRGQIF